MSLSTHSSISCTVGSEYQKHALECYGLIVKGDSSTEAQATGRSSNNLIPPANAVTTEKTLVPHMLQLFYMFLVLGKRS